MLFRSLIAERSPDIFLNNILYGKRSIQDMFSNVGNKLSEYDIDEAGACWQKEEC